MIDIFDTVFKEIRNKVNEVVLPFHPVFLTDEELAGMFESFFGELDEKYHTFSHFALFKSKVSGKFYAVLINEKQFEQKTTKPIFT
jgi:hypothetical protein